MSYVQLKPLFSNTHMAKAMADFAISKDRITGAMTLSLLYYMIHVKCKV